MSEGVDVKKWLIKFVREDLRIILTFLFVLLLLTFGFAMMMGYLGMGSADFRTPSVQPTKKTGLADTDRDSLPDIIEGTASQPCDLGEEVYDNTGRFIGYCTDTDPRDFDSDNDLFTDAVEDAMGTDPNNFFNPGWIYFVIAIYVFAFAFYRVYGGDPLKEYKEFEMKQSAGVSGKSGKFAYSGASVFGKKSAEEVSEEEKKQAIASDARFQRMTAEKAPEREKVKKKRNWTALLIQLGIAALISIFIFIVTSNAI